MAIQMAHAKKVFFILEGSYHHRIRMAQFVSKGAPFEEQQQGADEVVSSHPKQMNIPSHQKLLHLKHNSVDLNLAPLPPSILNSVRLGKKCEEN